MRLCMVCNCEVSYVLQCLLLLLYSGGIKDGSVVLAYRKVVVVVLTQFYH